jgi:hypothetical protein
MTNKGTVMIETERLLLIALTRMEFGYKREDGVYIAPLGCLKIK